MGKRGPKPGFKQARLDAAPAAAAPVVAPVTPVSAASTDEPVTSWPNPLRAGKRLQDMFGAELKAYARRVGVRPIDVENLTEDRLRQNCQFKLREIVDSLTE